MAGKKGGGKSYAKKPSNEKGTVGRVTPKKTGLFGSATLGSASNEKGTVGRVTPKKTGLFGSATLSKKRKRK